jgi:hypothetical protein
MMKFALRVTNVKKIPRLVALGYRTEVAKPSCPSLA